MTQVRVATPSDLDYLTRRPRPLRRPPRQRGDRVCLLNNGTAFTCTGYFHDVA